MIKRISVSAGAKRFALALFLAAALALWACEGGAANDDGDGEMPPVVNATFDGGATWEIFELVLPPEYDGYAAVGTAPIYENGALLYPVKLLKGNSQTSHTIDNYTDGIVYFESRDGGHSWVFMKPSPTPSMAESESGASTVTYVSFGGDADVWPHYSFYLPVSYIKDGVQMLTRENWQKTFANTESMYMTSGDFEKAMAGAPAPDDISMIEVDAMYSLGKNDRMDSIATNGDWDLFPARAAYEKHTLDNQPDRPEWSDYFKKEIGWHSYSQEAQPTDALAAPVVIAESWFFEWGGAEAALVTASNAVLTAGYGENTGAAPNPPSGGNTIMYTISALFVGGRPPILLHERYSPLNGAYSPRNDLPFPCSQYMSAVQADENGELMLCPVFSYDTTGDASDYRVSFKPEYMICDIDGDGRAELIQYNQGFSALFCNYSVWKLIDGAPAMVFAMRLA